MTFLLKTYDVQVQGFWQTYPYLASTPAKTFFSHPADVEEAA